MGMGIYSGFGGGAPKSSEYIRKVLEKSMDPAIFCKIHEFAENLFIGKAYFNNSLVEID